jgi:peptidoglycan L-alanyl-D-glutamate endopeptidase CwlK
MKTDSLEPTFRNTIGQLIMAAEIATGLDWIVTSCRRTMAEQQKIYDQGRTTSGPIITKAKPGYSSHNFGLGADLAPMKDGKIWWKAPDSVWKAMADEAVKLGLEAGYFWKSFHDAPHVQDPDWKTQQQLWKEGKLQLP